MKLLRRAPVRHPRPAPDERIWGRHYTGMRPATVGFLVLCALLALSYLAFTKKLPFTGEGYQLRATFENAATLRSDAPVRIAGVNVGEVTAVEPKGSAAEVTFTVSDEGRPIHDDATIEIRPRLFLEGNFFLDVRPGSPSAPELEDGAVIPIGRTSTAVQLDEILTSLQAGSRRHLQRLLEGYGTALTYRPTPLDEAGQDPAVFGETAARSLNDALRTGGRAARGTAIVSDALRGEGPHDLSRLIGAQARVFGRLSDRESQLRGLITNLNVTTGALAAESGNLSATVRELAPTLERAEPSLRHLSGALPPLRALARELEPSIRELPETIRAAGPWLDQAGPLLGDRELGGLAALLADATPGLARTTHASLRLFPEIELLSRCASDTLVPTGELVVNDTFATGQPNYREFFYGLVDFSGESQGFDGNGQYVRFQSGGGPTLARATVPGAGFEQNVVFGNTIEAPDGTQPSFPATGLPEFRTDVACHLSEAPNVNGPAAAVGPPSPEAVP